jgi:uncharacterized OB-fold protein
MSGEFTGAVPRNWRTRQQRYLLKAGVCLNCNEAVFPPRDVCPHCVEARKTLGQGLPEIQARPIGSQG